MVPAIPRVGTVAALAAAALGGFGALFACSEADATVIYSYTGTLGPGLTHLDLPDTPGDYTLSIQSTNDPNAYIDIYGDIHYHWERYWDYTNGVTTNFDGQEGDLTSEQDGVGTDQLTLTLPAPHVETTLFNPPIACQGFDDGTTGCLYRQRVDYLPYQGWFDFYADSQNPDLVVTITLDQAVAAPEPGIWAMLIMGLAATGALLRRRRAALSQASI